MFEPWYETDLDCCQHIRKNKSIYEMVQCVWLPTTNEDKENDLYEYVIVKGIIDLNDYSEEEKFDVVRAYGYVEEEIFDFYGLDGGNDLIAECILEESILCDSCIIGYANSFEEAEEKIKQYIGGE